MEGWRNLVDVPVSNRRATTLANGNKEPFSVLTENAFSWKAVRDSTVGATQSIGNRWTSSPVSVR